MRHAGFILTSAVVLAACSTDSLTAPETDTHVGLPPRRSPQPSSHPLRTGPDRPRKGTMTVSPAGRLHGGDVQPPGGQGPSGRRLVLLDVALRNLSAGLEFVAPSDPPPPSGYSGLMLYPYRTAATTGSGTAVESTQWDGPPHNFSGTTPCSRLSRTLCHRWEPYPLPEAGEVHQAEPGGVPGGPDGEGLRIGAGVAADLGGGAGAVQAHVESAISARWPASPSTPGGSPRVRTWPAWHW